MGFHCPGAVSVKVDKGSLWDSVRFTLSILDYTSGSVVCLFDGRRVS